MFSSFVRVEYCSSCAVIYNIIWWTYSMEDGWYDTLPDILIVTICCGLPAGERFSLCTVLSIITPWFSCIILGNKVELKFQTLPLRKCRVYISENNFTFCWIFFARTSVNNSADVILSSKCFNSTKTCFNPTKTLSCVRKHLKKVFWSILFHL